MEEFRMGEKQVEEDEEAINVRLKEEDDEGNKKGSGEGGIINTLISNYLVSPRTRRSEGNNGEKLDQFHSSKAIRKEEDDDDEGKKKGDDEADDDEMGGGNGGVVNSFISKFVGKNDVHRKADDDDEGNKDDNKGSVVEGQGEIGTTSTSEEQEVLLKAGDNEDSGSTGGIIKNLISNFSQQNEDIGDEGNEKSVVDGEVKQEKLKEEEGGGGIINNLVPSLSATLQGNAAPTTDEASILIHSIIHD